MRTGSCLCGGVRYRVNGPMRGVIACHCHRCRKQTGHYYAATAVPHDALEIEDREDRLTWYESSPGTYRGFCRQCGSALFWKVDGAENTSVLAGSLDGETGLKLDKHILTGEKGDYYDITDGLPQT